jgi:predicted secreted protein
MSQLKDTHMKRNLGLAAAFTVTALLVGCSNDEVKDPVVPDPQAKYEIAVNETIEFKLLEHSDGGYRWEWINKEKSPVADTVAFRTQSTNPDPQVCGASVNTIWTFKGLKAGTSTLKFEERRGFEPNSTINIKEVVIVVR